jgi:heat shock protein HslJ
LANWEEETAMRHIGKLGSLVLLIGLTLSAVGCAVSEKTPENGPTPTPVPMVGPTRMAALFIGTLTMSDGCLHVSDSYDSNLVVWPPDFQVSIGNDTIRVLYDDHEVEVRLGQVVRLGGGEVKSLEAFDERTRQGIPAGCPGPYWLVGSISTVEETERPGTTADLVGSEWVLVSLHGESLIEGTEINLVFEEAYLGGAMTCNGYGGGRDSGKYTAIGDGSLTIPHEIAVTLQLCSEPEGIMEQEAAYIEALRNAAAYRVIDDRLEIASAAGETILVFAREEFRPLPPTPTTVPPTPTPVPPTPTSIPPEDETADWKIYTNERYGYSLRYPPDCTFGPMPRGCKQKPPEERPPECLCFLNAEDPDRVFLQAFTGEKDDLTLATFSVSRLAHDPPPGTDLIEWIREKVHYEKIPEEPNAKVGDIPAVRFYSPRSPQAPSYEEIYFVKDNKFLLISMLDVDEKANRELYDRISSALDISVD